MATPEKEQNHFSNLSLTFWVLLLLGVVLRLYGLDRTLGGKDEAEMLIYFGYKPVQSIVSNYFETSNHIFHSVLTQWMVQLFGPDNEVGIRLPVFISGIACLWLIFKTALLFFRPKPKKPVLA